MMLLKREKVEVWLKALRSGDYAQGTQTLKRSYPDGDIYCCLGVAAQVLFQDEFRMENDGDWSISGNDALLGDCQLDDLGLGYTRQTQLTKLNDLENKDFNEIADVIEGWLVEDEQVRG